MNWCSEVAASMQQSGERNSAMDAIEETPGGSTVSSRKDRECFRSSFSYAFSQ